MKRFPIPPTRYDPMRPVQAKMAAPVGGPGVGIPPTRYGAVPVQARAAAPVGRPGHAIPPKGAGQEPVVPAGNIIQRAAKASEPSNKAAGGKTPEPKKPVHLSRLAALKAKGSGTAAASHHGAAGGSGAAAPQHQEFGQLANMKKPEGGSAGAAALAAPAKQGEAGPAGSSEEAPAPDTYAMHFVRQKGLQGLANRTSSKFAVIGTDGPLDPKRDRYTVDMSLAKWLKANWAKPSQLADCLAIQIVANGGVWTETRNSQWLLACITARKTFLLIPCKRALHDQQTDLEKKRKAGAPLLEPAKVSKTSEELEMLFAKGYRLEGGKLCPPAVQPQPPGPVVQGGAAPAALGANGIVQPPAVDISAAAAPPTK